MTGAAKLLSARPQGEALAGYRRIGFFTLPNYSMIALANALDARRMANSVDGREG